MKKITILFILVATIGYSQSTITKFKLSGVLFSEKDLDSNIITKFKQKKNVSILDYEFDNWWKVDFEGKLGFVSSTMLFLNDDMYKMIKHKENEKKEQEKARLNEIERKKNLMLLEYKRKQEKIDSLIYLKRRKKDSLKRVSDEQFRIDKLEREKRALEKIRMYHSKFTQKNKEQCCIYSVNEIDEFTSKIRIKTTNFSFSGEMYHWGPSITLVGYDQLKYVIFNASTDLGCASPYSNNRSYVLVKLENGTIVKFYHFGDIDCGDSFRLSGKLTTKDIINLKKSPIKSIRMSGTKFYHDFTDIKFKNIFINKLDCIN